MRVKVLYFAVVRERVRLGEELVEVAAGTTVGALLDELGRRHPAIAELRRYLQVARNQETAAADAVLGDGDEVALIPPVSGGSDGADGADGRMRVRGERLSLDEVVAAVAHEGAGGIVTFTGVVRRQSRGQAIVRLEYEAYAAMAEARMRAIGDAIEARWPGVRLAIQHRVGTLVVGEVAVVIAASAPHRAEAFAAAREAIERLKAEVPIWKKEIGETGEEWIGLGP